MIIVLPVFGELCYICPHSGQLTQRPSQTQPPRPPRPPTVSPALPDWWPKSSPHPSTSQVSKVLIREENCKVQRCWGWILDNTVCEQLYARLSDRLRCTVLKLLIQEGAHIYHLTEMSQVHNTNKILSLATQIATLNTH